MKQLLLFFFGLFLSTSLFAQTNLVTNGGFEEWDWTSGSPKPWERLLSGDVEKSTDNHSGTYSASLKTSSFSNMVNLINTPLLNFGASKTYTCTFYYKVKSGTLTTMEAALNYTGNVFPEAVTTKAITNFTPNVWTKVEFNYTEPTGRALNFRFYIKSSNNAEVLIDDVVIAEKSTTSIKNVDETNLAIYPNPTADYITVSGLENAQSIRICSLNGQLMKLVDLKSTVESVRIDLSTLPKGVYALNIIQKDSSVSRKIVKK